MKFSSSLHRHSFYHLARAACTSAATAAIAVTLTGCGVHLESAQDSLPELTAPQLVRDRAVRVDWAIAARADELADLAGQCEPCQKAWRDVADRAEQRVESLGGVWDPWPDGAPEGADLPDPIAEAPVAADAFVAWMAACAVRDLSSVADPALLSDADARILSRVAAARLADATTLGAVVGVDYGEGASSVLALANRIAARTFGDSAGGSARDGVMRAAQGILDAQEVAPVDTGTVLFAHLAPADQGMHSDQRDFTEDADVSNAVRVWDCVGQTLPALQVEGEGIADASATVDRLLERTRVVLNAGVDDTREFRCHLEESSPQSLDALMLATDLTLVDSADADVRALGVRSLAADIVAGAASGSADMSDALDAALKQ